MTLLKRAKYSFEYLIWAGLLFILVFSVFNDGGINILSHLLISASLIVFAVLYCLRSSKNHAANEKIKFGSEIIPLLFFIIIFFISFILSQTKNVGLFELILFISGVFLYLFFSSQKWEISKFEKFLLGVIAVGFISSMYGFFIYIFEPFNRFSSTFGVSIYNFAAYPNAFANFMIAVIPICFYFLHKKIRPLYGAVILTAATIMLTGFFLTYSRGGLIALSFIALIYVVSVFAANRNSLNRAVKRIFLLITVVFISAILTLPVNFLREINHPDINSVSAKITFEADEKDTSTSERFDFWQGSLLLFKQNPLFGTGPGSFSYVYPPYQQTLLGNSNSPHNLFLKLLVENGIFTMIFFALFLLLLIVRTFKVYNKIPSAEKLVLTVLYTSVFGSLLHNMIDYNLNFVSTVLLLFVFLGINGFIVNKYSKTFNIPPKNNTVKILFVLAGLSMFFIALHEVYYSYMFMQARAAHKHEDHVKADIYYEKSRNILLKRDLFIGHAQMLSEKYEEEGDIENLQKAESLLLEGLNLNKHDAFLVNFLGDVYLAMNRHEEARRYYLKAVKLDPKNNLDYYFDILNTQDSISKEDIKQTLDLLADYKNKLAVNAHLTILTGNPDFAINIHELLLVGIENTEFFDEYNEKIVKSLRETEQIHILEKEKFEKYYNLQLTKEK